MEPSTQREHELPRRRPWYANEEVAAGAFFVLVGGAALWIAFGYPAGSASRMSAGSFPRIVSLLLVLLGLVIAGNGARIRTDDRPHPQAGEWRAALFVPLALVAFAGTIETLGLAPAVVTTVVVLAYAERNRRWRETIAIALALCVVTDLLFIRLLGLPILPYPDF